MNSEQLDFYKENGYLILRDVIPKTVVADLIHSMDRLGSDAEIIRHHQDSYNYEKKAPAHLKIIRRIQSPEKILPVFDQIPKADYLLKPLSKILGPNIRLERSKIHIKAAKYGAKIPLHQDWAYQVYTNDDVLIVGVFIDECTKLNAPVYVVPGSHKGQVYPHINSEGVFSGFVDTQKYDIDVNEMQPLTGKPGDISLHHYRMLHRSAENLSDSSRRLLLLRYAAADAWPLLGTLDFGSGFNFDEMKNRIVMGEQTVEPRLKAVPVRMPIPYPKSFTA